MDKASIQLLYEQTLWRSSSSALIAAVRRKQAPLVLQALVHQLGHRACDLSKTLGVSPQTFANWLAARFPIPEYHHARLVALLRSAIKVSEATIASAPAEAQDALPAYRERVDRARQILEEIDAEN